MSMGCLEILLVLLEIVLGIPLSKTKESASPGKLFYCDVTIAYE